jgi:hypothetical protein
MAALARALSRATGIEIDIDSLRAIVILCGTGLLLSLLFILYGADGATSSADWIPPA